MQFNNDGDGEMRIGAPAHGISNPQYENPEAFRAGLRYSFNNQGTSCVLCCAVHMCAVLF